MVKQLSVSAFAAHGNCISLDKTDHLSIAMLVVIISSITDWHEVLTESWW
jgi:hypothetical protein